MANALSGSGTRAASRQFQRRAKTTDRSGTVAATKDNAHSPLLRLWEFDAIAKNVRVGYVFFFDDRDEYLEGDRVVG
jgi:hypothetical protein